MTVRTCYCVFRGPRESTLHAGLPLHRQVVPRVAHEFIPAQVFYSNPTNTHGFPYLSSYYDGAFLFIYTQFLIGTPTQPPTPTHTHAHTQACKHRTLDVSEPGDPCVLVTRL